MSDYTYTVEPDANDALPLIWRHEGPDDPAPKSLTEADEDMFRAAAAVLAPDDDVRELVFNAIYVTLPAGFVTSEGAIVVDRVQAAVLAALRDHATGGDQ